VGDGSTFTLEMPLTLRTRNALDITPLVLQRGNDAEGQPVLLVEDNPVNQAVVQAMLRSLGFEVVVAGDGAQAISLAARQRFCAVLMDCRLPIVDGYEATRRIRQLSQCQHLPIIALTANALQGDRERCLAAGMNDYLAKPFKRTDLQQILQRWLPGETVVTGE